MAKLHLGAFYNLMMVLVLDGTLQPNDGTRMMQLIIIMVMIADIYCYSPCTLPGHLI